MQGFNQKSSIRGAIKHVTSLNNTFNPFWLSSFASPVRSVRPLHWSKNFISASLHLATCLYTWIYFLYGRVVCKFEPRLNPGSAPTVVGYVISSVKKENVKTCSGCHNGGWARRYNKVTARGNGQRVTVYDGAARPISLRINNTRTCRERFADPRN